MSLKKHSDATLRQMADADARAQDAAHGDAMSSEERRLRDEIVALRAHVARLQGTTTRRRQADQINAQAQEIWKLRTEVEQLRDRLEAAESKRFDDANDARKDAEKRRDALTVHIDQMATVGLAARAQWQERERMLMAAIEKLRGPRIDPRVRSLRVQRCTCTTIGGTCPGCAITRRFQSWVAAERSTSPDASEWRYACAVHRVELAQHRRTHKGLVAANVTARRLLQLADHARNLVVMAGAEPNESTVAAIASMRIVYDDKRRALHRYESSQAAQRITTNRRYISALLRERRMLIAAAQMARSAADASSWAVGAFTAVQP